MINYSGGTRDSTLREPLRKLECGSQDSAQTRSYVELVCATASLMHLNASALSDLNSLCIPLVSPLVCAPDHLQPIPIQTLVDSGSMHCFLDSIREPLRGDHSSSYWIVPEAKLRFK